MKLKRFNESTNHESLDLEGLKELIESTMDKYNFRPDYKIIEEIKLTNGSYHELNEFSQDGVVNIDIIEISYVVNIEKSKTVLYNNHIKNYLDTINIVSDLIDKLKIYYNSESLFNLDRSNITISKSKYTNDDYYKLLLDILKIKIGKDINDIKLEKEGNDYFIIIRQERDPSKIQIPNIKASIRNLLSSLGRNFKYENDDPTESMEKISIDTVRIKNPKLENIKFTI